MKRTDRSVESASQTLRASRVDRMLSIAAGVAAVTAVVVSLYQAALAREQLRASAWPHLAQSNSFTPGNPYLRTVSNQGVGLTCYCSVYDECWIADSRKEEPRDVDSCPSADAHADFQP
jgi:hypothetical protein